MKKMIENRKLRSEKYLTVTLMIMIIALVLNHGFAAKEILHKQCPAFPSRRPLEGNLPERNDRFRSMTARAFRRSKRIKNAHRRNWFLNPVAISLKNVIDKYELKEEQLKALYLVEACGLSGCGKFRDLIPENQIIKDLKCPKRKRTLKMAVLDFLCDFHGGVLIIEQRFQILLEFEEIPNLNNDERRKILRELKTDLKSLNLELESVMVNQRLNLVRLAEILSPALLPPKSETHLMIYEWWVIQGTKRFLEEWQVNLQQILRCWRNINRPKAGIGGRKRAT